jgi:hypothetical protein
MRILGFIIVSGAALFAYGALRPSTPPAPAPAANFAMLPADTKSAEPPKATSRPEAARQAQTRSTAPLSLAPSLPGQAPHAARVATAQTPAPAPSPQTSTAKRTAEVLTAAAIAALIVEASRRAYYATGHPCACPDDRMRNDRSCGGRSAYSRPGGASPLCYDIARQDPPPGVSPEVAAVAIAAVLDGIGDTCPECRAANET